MPDLIAKSPLSGRGPLTLGAVTLSEIDLLRISSVAPLKGQGAPLSRALKTLGLAFPEPGEVSAAQDVRLVWTARDQAFLIGVDPAPLAGHAALTDQSDGWAGLSIKGAGAEVVLARLYPLDLRAAAFGQGRTIRAPLNHMSSILLRTGPDAFEILVFRSMARTAWHEIETAMQGVAARVAIG